MLEKKKLLSMLLTLIMAVAMMPASVFAEDAIAYDLWVGGVQVTSDHTQGTGWSYDGDNTSGTLTLTNALITGVHNNKCIDVGDIDLTLNLVGDNTVGGDSVRTAVDSDKDLTITGSGSLSVKCERTGIWISGKLTVDDATVSSESTEFESIICVGMELRGAKLTAYSKELGGIDAQHDVVITKSELTAGGGSTHPNRQGTNSGLWCQNLTVTDSKLDCFSGDKEDPNRPSGILATGNVTITNSTVKARSEKGNGITSRKNIELTDSTIEARSAFGGGIGSDGNMIIKDSIITATGHDWNWYQGTLAAGEKMEITDAVITVESYGNLMGLYAEGGISFLTGNGIKATYIEVESKDTQEYYAVHGDNCDITLGDNLAIVLPEEGTVGKVGDSNHAVILDGDAAAKHVIIKDTIKETAYKITIEDSANGTVSILENIAVPGKEIVVTATPDEGFEIDNISFTDASGTKTDITEDRSFRMPASDVTVKVTFKEKKTEPDPEGKTEEPDPEGKTEGQDPERKTEKIKPETKPGKAESVATKISDAKLLARLTVKGKNNLVVTWNKISGAEGYDIFFRKCSSGNDQSALRFAKTVKSKQLKWMKAGLKTKTAYKALVKAWVMKKGQKKYIKVSPIVHAFTSGGNKKYTNPKSVTVKKANVTLKKGKSFKIRATVKKLKKARKLIPSSHAPKLRYLSSDTSVAKVTGQGKITAVTKGTCRIYAYAANGVKKTVKVRVK